MPVANDERTNADCGMRNDENDEMQALEIWCFLGAWSLEFGAFGEAVAIGLA